MKKGEEGKPLRVLSPSFSPSEAVAIHSSCVWMCVDVKGGK